MRRIFKIWESCKLGCSVVRRPKVHQPRTQGPFGSLRGGESPVILFTFRITSHVTKGIKSGGLFSSSNTLKWFTLFEHWGPRYPIFFLAFLRIANRSLFQTQEVHEIRQRASLPSWNAFHISRKNKEGTLHMVSHLWESHLYRWPPPVNS